MRNGHRSAWRRRVTRSRAARIAVPLAIPMALALTLGIFLAVSGHGVSSISQSALGSCDGPAASPAADVATVTATNPAPAPTSATDPTSGTDPTSATGPTSATDPTPPTDPTSATDPTPPTDPTSATGPASGTDPAPASSTDPASPTAAASPTAPASAPASASPTASPCPSGSASASAPAVAAAANVNCDIIVPANPLSAQGLATPYQLTGPDGMTPTASGCTMTNAANLGAFVQATILNPRTGALAVYSPLVITQGTTPAVAPVVPRLPRNAVVTIDFGFNGTDLIQAGATPNALQQGNCINGQQGSDFGQVSFCNGTNFFNTAFRLEREGRLRVPFEGTSAKIVASGGRLGTGNDCPVTRNFDMVDQDPSDNVTTEYLLNPATGQTAQNTTANASNIPGSTPLLNGSDNTLLDTFMDPVLGCTPFQAPDLANNRRPTSSQALNELLAARNQPRIAALVPENDEMTLDGNGQFDNAKTNLYREEVGQAPVSFQNNRTSSPAMFCQNMVNIQTPFVAANQTLLATGQSPVAGVGDNLFTFLANRLSMSFANLNCQNFGLTNPVTVTLDGNGVAVAATFNTTMQTATNTTATPTASASASASASPSASASTAPGGGQHRGRRHHWFMNPSGM
jgi:hypothetical protein